jgi:hypothetical protein
MVTVLVAPRRTASVHALRQAGVPMLNDLERLAMLRASCWHELARMERSARWLSGDLVRRFRVSGTLARCGRPLEWRSEARRSLAAAEPGRSGI